MKKISNFILGLILLFNFGLLNAQAYQNEKGIIGLMYHRFEENKYP